MLKAIGLSGLVVGLLVATAQAADVEVKGAHLCCGQCVKAVGGTLGKVEGVSNAACDREAKTIKFTSTDTKVARQALRRLAFAGFYGKATIDGKAAELAPSGAKKGQKADTVTLRNVHLCCGGCVKAAGAAAKTVKGVDSVKCDRKHRTVTLSGKDIDVSEAVAALNKAGFFARVGGGKKKKKQ